MGRTRRLINTAKRPALLLLVLPRLFVEVFPQLDMDLNHISIHLRVHVVQMLDHLVDGAAQMVCSHVDLGHLVLLVGPVGSHFAGGN